MKMRMSQYSLDILVLKHKDWLKDNKTGERLILQGVDLRDVDLRSANLSGAKLKGAYLRGADLRYAYLNGANLRDANLRDADLKNADLRYVDLKGADLSYTDLTGVYLSYANLRGADLTGVNLSGAKLRGADLSGTYLSSANLSGAKLKGAYLRGADLSSADLSSADLRGVDLEDADLRGVDLSGADLTGAYLKGSNLSNAVGKEIIVFKGTRAFAYSCDGNIQIGCKHGTISYWLENYKEICKANGYSDLEIEEYGNFIKQIARSICVGGGGGGPKLEHRRDCCHIDYPFSKEEVFKKVYYLASPYSHPDLEVMEQRYETSLKVAAQLTKAGYVLIQPLAMSEALGTKYDFNRGYEQWKEVDRALVAKADGIILLKIPGWEESIGVQDELKLNKELGHELWAVTVDEGDSPNIIQTFEPLYINRGVSNL